MKNKGLYEKKFKRGLDFILSLLLIIILFPFLMIIALLVKIKLGSPVLFKQERPGKNEVLFRLYKFRTMTEKRSPSGELLPDSERLTNFGKFLRSTSLDELPELFNILKGDMSFVGPRPLAVQYLPFYTAEERKRHQVRPGLTGLAQINGRNSSTWEFRFMNDIDYIESISFIKDAKIIFATIIAVIKRKDIGVRGTNSLQDFDSYRKGSENNGISK